MIGRSCGQPNRSPPTWPDAGDDEQLVFTHLFGEVAKARFDRAVEMANGRELLEVRRDLLLAHYRYGALDRGETVGVVEVHALGALEIEEVAERLLPERQQRELDATRVVPRRLGQVRTRQMRACSERVDEVAVEREMEHLLLGDHQERLSPSLDRTELVFAQPLIGGALQRERREQVLAHQRVLELGGGAEHVDQRLAVFDHQRSVARVSGVVAL